MKVSFDDRSLLKTLNGLVDYSFGYVEGIKRGKRLFLKNIGDGVIEALQVYIDASARMNKDLLHHVYEWYQVGSPSGRLFTLEYTISNLGLSVKSSFSQSKTIKNGSSVPFYDKARIMENGIGVTIRPKQNGVLAFEDSGTTVFTSRPVEVEHPGGQQVKGEFERVFDEFFKNYFAQSFLNASGIYSYIKNPVLYKKELKAGIRRGKAHGIKTGYTWIINAKVGVDK